MPRCSIVVIPTHPWRLGAALVPAVREPLKVGIAASGNPFFFSFALPRFWPLLYDASQCVLALKCLDSCTGEWKPSLESCPHPRWCDGGLVAAQLRGLGASGCRPTTCRQQNLALRCCCSTRGQEGGPVSGELTHGLAAGKHLRKTVVRGIRTSRFSAAVTVQPHVTGRRAVVQSQVVADIFWPALGIAISAAAAFVN